MNKNLVSYLLFFLLTASLQAQQVRVDTVRDGIGTYIIHTQLHKGIVHGKRTWYKNDTLVFTQTYVMGFQEGPETWYAPNGAVESTSHFEEGVLHGVQTIHRAGGKKVKNYFNYGEKVDENLFYELNY